MHLLRTFFASPCRHPDSLSYMHPHFLLIILQLLFKSSILMLDTLSDLVVYLFHSKDFSHFAILEGILNLKRVLGTRREVFRFNMPETRQLFNKRNLTPTNYLACEVRRGDEFDHLSTFPQRTESRIFYWF